MDRYSWRPGTGLWTTAGFADSTFSLLCFQHARGNFCVQQHNLDPERMSSDAMCFKKKEGIHGQEGNQILHKQRITLSKQNTTSGVSWKLHPQEAVEDYSFLDKNLSQFR